MKKYKNNLVPKLRFPEFINSPEWEEKTLGDICQKISLGGTPDTSKPEFWNGSIEWLTPAEMGRLNTKFISSTKRKITQDGLKNCSSDLLPANSVIMSTRAPIGHLVINTMPMAINQGCKGLIPNENTNYNFLYFNLLINKNEMIKLGAGNTFKELSSASLKNVKLLIPSLPEQQKIADCLSSLDELITAENEKLKYLKEHKKGLMQKLFPAEGESVPELRFPEFRNSGDWEEKELGELGNTFSGLINKSKEDFGTGRPYISYMNIFLNPIINIKNFEYVRIDDNENQSKVQYGDIFFTTSSETPTEVGMSSVLLDNVDEVYLNSFCFGFRLHNFNTLLPLFATYYFRSKCFRIILNKLSQGVTRFNLSKNKMMKCYINLPKSIKEQQKIADCLSSLDDLINAQDNKIKKLKEHKKGLMQGLFPSATDMEKVEY